LLIALGRNLEVRNPILAATIYPLNVEAKLQHAIQILSTRDSENSEVLVNKNLQALIPYNSGDARLYSLLGESSMRLGNDIAGVENFNHALVLAKTEIHAAQWAAQRAFASKNYDEALKHLDSLFRRWPSQIGLNVPIISEIMSNPDGYVAFLTQIEKMPPWRSPLLSLLSSYNLSSKILAAQLLQDLANGPTPPKSAETARLLLGLFQEKKYDLAYTTFLLTLSTSERDLSGHVFNGNFKKSATNRYFDWAVRQQPGVLITLPVEKDGLSLEFASTPVTRIGLQQFLKLTPGVYRIELDVSALKAVMPKSLFWSLTCIDTKGPIVQLDVPEGDYKSRSVSVEFRVPANCPLQTLALQTQALVESWNNRYSGRVVFHRMRISKVKT